MANPRPKSGYGYTALSTPLAWRTVSDEYWETHVVSPEPGRWAYVGKRYIDGSQVNVWQSRRSYDNKGSAYLYIAQTTVMTGRALQENPSSFVPFALGALLAGGLVWWALRPKEAQAATLPAGQACPITDAMLVSYVKTKTATYVLYLPPEHTQPVASWPAPKPDYFKSADTHAFSVKDCGFYKWDGSKWVSDEVENQALAKFISARVDGPPALTGHPASTFMF